MNTRRNFLKTLGRSLTAGAILGTSGYLLLRESSEESCDFDFPCSSCEKLSSCKEQKAADFKKIKQ